MPTLQQLQEREKHLEKERKLLKSKIREVVIKEKTDKYVGFGREMEKLYNDDPTCKNTAALVAICKKHFVSSEQPSPPASTEKKGTDGSD